MDARCDSFQKRTQPFSFFTVVVCSDNRGSDEITTKMQKMQKMTLPTCFPISERTAVQELSHVFVYHCLSKTTPPLTENAVRHPEAILSILTRSRPCHFPSSLVRMIHTLRHPVSILPRRAAFVQSSNTTTHMLVSTSCLECANSPKKKERICMYVPELLRDGRLHNVCKDTQKKNGRKEKERKVSQLVHRTALPSSIPFPSLRYVPARKQYGAPAEKHGK